MPCIEWSPFFSVGVEKMDTQHRELIAITNEYCEAYHANKGHLAIPGILNRLVNYAEEHFQEEEKMMQAIGFEGLEDHKVAHEKIVDKIFAILQEHEKGALAVADDLNEFLREWLLEHILKEDMQYRDVFVAQRRA
jgi:hemerythrin